MGIFSCPCCVCVLVAGVCSGEQGLVKTFTAWKILASLENTGSGTVGYSAGRIAAGQRWQFLTIHIENVIISVTMITKMLFVTRPPNLRCKPLLPLGV